MRREDFSFETPGRLVSVGDQRWAFVPDPLPPKLDYGPRLVAALWPFDSDWSFEHGSMVYVMDGWVAEKLQSFRAA